MNDIYTPLEDARQILGDRMRDQALVQRVTEYVGGILPDIFVDIDKPIGVLARYVPRGTSEDRLFTELAQEGSFRPYCFSYLADGYTVRNPEKVDIVRPPINWGRDKTRRWIADVNDRRGPVGEITTQYGMTSAEFQRGLRQVVFDQAGYSNLVDNVFDLSEWYRLQADRLGGGEQRSIAELYYEPLMALYCVFGALFENFYEGPNTTTGDLALFTANILEPVIERNVKALGVKPVIVRLPAYETVSVTNLAFLSRDEREQLEGKGRLGDE